jgi:hypothetical protein
MKWKKLGKIFNPTDYNLPEGCTDFSQAPQAVVFDDYVRIYFSTRRRDKDNYFVSHIAWVDFDHSFQNVIRISQYSPISLGKLGCYDEHGIFPLHVVRANDKLLGYISGISRRLSVSVDASIGLALSTDNGDTFIRIGDGPILTSSLKEPFLICDPFVSIIDGVYHMLYVYGIKWTTMEEGGAPERVYKIGYAQSLDGIKWKQAGRQLIENVLGVDECQALPTFFCQDGKYHMLFCFRHASGFRKESAKAYRIGYAWSFDLVNWQRADELAGINVSEGEWDSDMLCYPHVFSMDDEIYLLYNGNEFGRHGFGLAILDHM